MTRAWWLAGAAALIGGSSLVLAQETAPAPEPVPEAAPPSAASTPADPAPARPARGAPAPAASAAPAVDIAKLPTLQQLEAMSTEQLDELFGLRPTSDIPPGAERALERVGVIDSAEGGLPPFALVNQPAPLVRAALAGARGPVVSRWGHIVLRRALASRMDAPEGMDPADFAALRAAALNALGEHGVARALVQDVDTARYTPALTNAAFDAYVGTGDITGACPAALLGKARREDPEWKMLAGICRAYDGEATRAQNDLRRLQNRGEGERIDNLLAQRLAGAAGSGRKSVTIEWNRVTAMTPWRFALVNAVGETLPENLSADLAPDYLQRWAVAPMATPAQRVRGSDPAGQSGLLSSAAMVDLYSQLFASDGDGDESLQTAAGQLREAYVARDPAARVAAIRALWDGGGERYRYARMALTAYAAARVTPSEDRSEDAGLLIGSMLAAGLDRDAMRWSGVVEDGSLGWALLALARPQAGDPVSAGAIGDFADTDDTAGQRKAKMLLAGLAGLGRMPQNAVDSAAGDLRAGLGGATRWTRAIDAAAAARNPTLVVLLAGLGMQGSEWRQMTPRHLYHIVSALNRVGLGAEARMIAAEAVVRA